MIDLISLHIPKTGGTSFYRILQEEYGDHVSMSYKRRDYQAALKENGSLEATLHKNKKILHGHFYYQEVKNIHATHKSKIICWLRDPVERVISNHSFFIRGLNDPDKNPVNYEINKHRKNESLIEYAKRPENQNRMSDFLRGIELEELFFFGFLENFSSDLERLSKLLDWNSITIPKLNQGVQSDRIQHSESLRNEIKSINKEDLLLFKRAQQLLKKN